jgi:hypothetical protein
MAQILASSKVPANKYDNFSVDPNKVLPRVDIQQLAANFKEAYEVFQGYSLSGDEGSNEAIANLLSIIGVGDVDTYKNSLTKMIQTAVSNASRLEVDGASTANAIILNEPTIGNPIAPDGNDYTKSVPLPFEYVDGLSFIFRATDNNNGATTVQIPNLTGLAGAVDILDEQENPLVGGELVANKYYKIVAKTVSTVKKFLLVKRTEKATKSEMEAETLEKFPDAAVLKNHPGVAKAWVKFNGTGTVSILDSYNVASITDHGVGDWTINFTTNFANVNYVGVGMGLQAIGNNPIGIEKNSNRSVTVSSFPVVAVQAPNRADIGEVFVVFFGEQA